MRVFRASRPVSRADATEARACHRCGAPIPLDGRAIEAQSIVEGTRPSLFHIGCAPAEDNLRWRGRREIPMQVVRDDAPGS